MKNKNKFTVSSIKNKLLIFTFVVFALVSSPFFASDSYSGPPEDAVTKRLHINDISYKYLVGNRVRVLKVNPKDKPGIQEYDDIYKWNGRKIQNEAHYKELVSSVKSGDIVKLEIVRAGGEEMTIDFYITFTETEKEKAPRNNIPLAFAGILWTDNIQQINKKLQKTGLFSSVRNLRSDEKDVYGRAETLNLHGADGWELNKEYDKACINRQAASETALYKVTADRIKSSSNPMDRADFFFSAPNGVLLYYIVYFDQGSFQNIYDSAIDKYGEQDYIHKNQHQDTEWAIWKNDTEVLCIQMVADRHYSMNAIYYNPGNIREKIKRCEIKSEQINKESKSKGKLF